MGALNITQLWNAYLRDLRIGFVAVDDSYPKNLMYRKQ